MGDGDGGGCEWGGGGVIGMTHRYRVIGVVLTAFKQIMKNVYICTVCQCSGYNQKKANAERTKAEPERKQTDPRRSLFFNPGAKKRRLLPFITRKKKHPSRKPLPHEIHTLSSPLRMRQS